MTETNEFKTTSVNTLVTGTDSGREILVVGLKPEYQDKPQYQKALKLEYDKCHELEHPNILKYIEEKNIDNIGQCIVMEWEPARTLDEYIKENHSREEEKQIVGQIADALSFLHRNGMVHGALNPSNVFVTLKGDQVKILNFRQQFVDLLRESLNNRKFRAPEAKDGTVVLDERTDIYSLGTILKEMNIGEDYANVVKSSCAFGRNDRFNNIDEFIEAFEHRRTSHRAAATTSSANSNKRTALLVSAIAILAIVGGIVLYNKNFGSATTNEPATEQTAANTTAEQPEATTETEAPAQQQAPAEASQPTTPAPTAGQAYTGNLAFLNDLVPQMHIDIDKIYASAPDNTTLKRKVSVYYKGLRKALGNLTDEQFAAYDKEFADYIKQKNAAQ